jgi:hypothetical protein
MSRARRQTGNGVIRKAFLLNKVISLARHQKYGNIPTSDGNTLGQLTRLWNENIATGGRGQPLHRVLQPPSGDIGSKAFFGGSLATDIGSI